ncbi:MAG: hypothetical protein SFU84_15005 [Gemmatimonadales bacterium]|nr:hypothetical protein [Gemmatimonadales bacterium]
MALEAWTVVDWIRSHAVVDVLLQAAVLAFALGVIGGVVLWVMYVTCHVKHWRAFYEKPPSVRPLKIGGVSLGAIEVDDKQQVAIHDQEERLAEAEDQIVALLAVVEGLEIEMVALARKCGAHKPTRPKGERSEPTA